MVWLRFGVKIFSITQKIASHDEIQNLILKVQPNKCLFALPNLLHTSHNGQEVKTPTKP